MTIKINGHVVELKSECRRAPRIVHWGGGGGGGVGWRGLSVRLYTICV